MKEVEVVIRGWDEGGRSGRREGGMISNEVVGEWLG